MRLDDGLTLRAITGYYFENIMAATYNAFTDLRNERETNFTMHD